MEIKGSFEIMSKYNINDIVSIYDNNGNIIVGIISDIYKSSLEYTKEGEYKLCIKYDIEYLNNEAGQYKRITSLSENEIIYVLRRCDLDTISKRIEDKRCHRK